VHNSVFLSSRATLICTVAPLNTSEARGNPDAHAALFKPQDDAEEQNQVPVEDGAVKTQSDDGEAGAANVEEDDDDSQSEGRKADGGSSHTQGSADDDTWGGPVSDGDDSASDSVAVTQDVGTQDVCTVSSAEAACVC
jgi:hypothetical protein